MRPNEGVNTPIQVIPFRARHLLEIKPDADAEMQRLALLAQTGPAYTGFLMGKAVGAAGVYITGDIGEAWTLFNPAIKAFPLFLHKTVKRLLNEVAETVPEIYAICSDDGEWLKRLGFGKVKEDDGMLYVRCPDRKATQRILPVLPCEIHAGLENVSQAEQGRKEKVELPLVHKNISESRTYTERSMREVWQPGSAEPSRRLQRPDEDSETLPKVPLRTPLLREVISRIEPSQSLFVRRSWRS